MEPDYGNVFRPGDEESQFIFDPETKLESALLWVLFVSLVFLLVAGLFCFENGPSSWPILMPGITLALLGGSAYSFTENYYILDCHQRRVLYHRQFFGKESTKEIATFANTKSVCVNGYLRHSRYRIFWEHSVNTLTAQGELLVLANNLEFELACELADKAAELLDCEVQPLPQAGRKYLVKNLSLVPQSTWLSYLKYILSTLAIVLSASTCLILSLTYFHKT